MRDIVKNSGIDGITKEWTDKGGETENCDKGGWIGAEEVSKKAGWISQGLEVL